MSLEEVSNRNLVRWYAEELALGEMKKISGGARAKMRRFGILEPQGQKPYGFRLMLTAYGERLLREVKNMNETEETKENVETQPEGNLGAVNRVRG